MNFSKKISPKKPKYLQTTVIGVRHLIFYIIKMALVVIICAVYIDDAIVATNNLELGRLFWTLCWYLFEKIGFVKRKYMLSIKT